MKFVICLSELQNEQFEIINVIFYYLHIILYLLWNKLLWITLLVDLDTIEKSSISVFNKKLKTHISQTIIKYLLFLKVKKY